MNNFLKSALIRAIRTVSQTAVSLIGVSTFTEIDWIFVLETSVLAGILSILTSVATGLPEVESNENETN